jgi:D(-)-tartrate dehydratase
MRILDIQHRSVSVSRYSPEIAVSAAFDTTIVAIVTDRKQGAAPIIGYGFASIGRFAQDGLIRERFAPRLLRAEPNTLMNADGVAIDPSRAWQTMMAGEKPGGHGERCVAVGALDMAIWDAVAKARGLPLCRLLAQEFGNLDPLSSVPVYAGGGYYFPDNDLGRLRAEVQYFRDLGFLSAKIKIGALDIAKDCKRIETALDVVGSGSNLAVDAIYSYAPHQAPDIARAIEPYGLRWFEDICDPLDYETLANVVRVYRPPISAGEATFSLSDARNLLRYARLRSGRDVLTFDPAHCYGINEFVRIIRLFEQDRWAATSFQPHGGHLYGLHLAAGLRLGGCECNPHNFQPFGGFADDTIIAEGLVCPPAVPGIGFENRAALMDLFRSLA